MKQKGYDMRAEAEILADINELLLEQQGLQTRLGRYLREIKEAIKYNEEK